MPGQEAVDLLVQAANAAQAERAGSPLAPSERMALRYFARANRFSRTENALAEFQSIGLSQATLLVASLVSGGYLKQELSRDGGESSFEVTEASQKLLDDDPYGLLLRAVDKLEPEKQVVLCQALRRVLNELVEDSAHWYLNSCRNCSEFAGARNGAGRCNVLGTDVLAGDMSALCINFSPKMKTGKVAGQ